MANVQTQVEFYNRANITPRELQELRAELEKARLDQNYSYDYYKNNFYHFVKEVRELANKFGGYPREEK